MPNLLEAAQRVYAAERRMAAITLAMQQARDVETVHALAQLHHDAELDMLRAENIRLSIRLVGRRKKENEFLNK